ncbi:MAG: hypothetical protein D6784_08195 [Chloroflexi bacterium]|nr:MAG: hypothetical protein D6784_08195 [Chloroflexota bacterium]
MLQADEYRQIKNLCQSFNQHLMTLADSLQSRLTPIEEDALTGLLQCQINLQSWVDRQASGPASGGESGSPPSQAPDPDSVAYAQALQYARDLVKTMRQKREQQRRLELTAQQLVRAEKLATVGQVAATVAHELGNILTPLLMYAKLIHKEASENPDCSEIADFAMQITQIASRASNMLRQLVDAARRESSMEIPVYLPQVIQNALDLLGPQFTSHHIEVVKQFAPNTPPVVGRPDQLEQVFINLCLNAIDAMPDGGILTISLSVTSGRNGKETQDRYLLIRVSDTGMGIPPENIGKLFEPFFTTKERGAGSGLGLFVSHLIVDQHGGALEVDSRPGLGATFTIKLPISRQKDG